MKLLTTIALSWALSFLVEACLLPHELGIGSKAVAAQGASRTIRQGTGYPIGKGDRFRHGAIIPQGLGTNDRNLTSILNIEEVASGLEALAQFPTVRLFDAPHATYENRTIHGAVIGDGTPPRAFIQSGLHARERGGPDNVLYFVADLLAAAQDGKKGLRYGNQTYTNAQVRTALSAGIVVVPLTNPDGMHHDQQTGRCWRKNRNPNNGSSTTGGSGGGGNGDAGWGVDLNRNFDFLWDLKRYFDPDAQYVVGSNNPASEVYHGAAPASEPEVRNIQWIMAQHANLSWFLDLHSFEGDVLFSWGDDNAQTTDPDQNFRNSKYDGQRGGGSGVGDAYREYMEPADFEGAKNLSERMCDAMSRAGDVTYRSLETADLYPTSGTSTDYALSQYYGHKCGASKIQGLTIEFGGGSDFACPFYPTEKQYHESIRQVGVALMEFLLVVAGPGGEPKHWKC